MLKKINFVSGKKLFLRRKKFNLTKLYEINKINKF